MPSKRPNESLATAPPPQLTDPREQILNYFVTKHSNKQAARMLMEIRGAADADRAEVSPQPSRPQTPTPDVGPPTLPDPFEEDMPDEGEITDVDLGSESSEVPPVEGEAPPSPSPVESAPSSEGKESAPPVSGSGE